MKIKTGLTIGIMIVSNTALAYDYADPYNQQQRFQQAQQEMLHRQMIEQQRQIERQMFNQRQDEYKREWEERMERNRSGYGYDYYN